MQPRRVRASGTGQTMTPPGGSDMERAELRVAGGKEALLADIEHLRRTVAYDYPPESIRVLEKQVHRAEIHYREAWRERERLYREAAPAPAAAARLTAEREFLDASIAVWREIDRRQREPGSGYTGLSAATDLRRRERAAWERYRDEVLDASEGRAAAMRTRTARTRRSKPNTKARARPGDVA
jgi:hypothetical protein